MKKKTAGILLGVLVSASIFSGCGENQATEAANESIETENEGNGDIEETEEAEKEKKEKAESEKAEKDKKESNSEDKADESLKEAAAEETEEEAEEEPSQKVGILLPSEGFDRRQNPDGAEIKTQLEEAGYEAEVLYAKENAETQVSQIRELLEDETLAALVISPADEYGLSQVLEEVKEREIPVFAYDKLIMNTDAVKYFVTFDTREIGHQIAENLVKTMDLKKAREDRISYTIEFFMGSPDDRAALFLYNGILEGLQEYFDDGTLVCRSQRLTFDENAVMRWNADSAKADLKEIIEQFYPEEGTPDIICTAYDGFARAVMEQLVDSGIRPGQENWPLVTGIGAEAESVKSVAEQKQGLTIFLDRTDLAEECVKVTDTYLKGEKPEVKDYKQYDNGVKIIGAITCDGKVIDKDNYQILTDNGFYQEWEIAPEEAAEAEPELTQQPEKAPEHSIRVPDPEE